MMSFFRRIFLEEVLRKKKPGQSPGFVRVISGGRSDALADHGVGTVAIV